MKSRGNADRNGGDGAEACSYGGRDPRLCGSYYPALSGPSYGQIHLATNLDGGNGRAGVNGKPLLFGQPTEAFTTKDGEAGGTADATPVSAAERRRQQRVKYLCCCCCVLATGLLAVSGFLLLSYLPAFRPPALPPSTSSSSSSSAAASAAAAWPSRAAGCQHGGAVASATSAGSSAAAAVDGTAAAVAGQHCLGHACLKSAAEMEEMLNRSADPCADFFAFACGGWLADNHMPPTAAVWSRLERLQLATDGHLREMLEEAGGEVRPDAAGSLGGRADAWEPKLKAFYEACVSVEDPRLVQCRTGSSARASAAADSDNDGVVGDVGGGGGAGGRTEDEFQSLLNTCQGKRRLSDRVICLQVDLGVDALFKLRAVASPWTSGQQILLLDEYNEPDLGDPASSSDRARIRSLVATLVDDLGHLGASVGRNYAESVLTVLDALAEISLPDWHQFKLEPQLRAERVTVGELRQKLEGSLIQFDQLIAYFLHRNQETNVDSVAIAVGNLEYFTRLGNLVKQLRDDDLKKFLEFSIILKYAPFYSSRSRRDLLRHRARLRGQEHAEEDWLPCLQQLRGPGLNAVYYKEQRTRLRLDLVTDTIVPYLKSALIDLVRNNTDVNQSVKAKVIDKVRSMRILVGFSEAYMTQQFLDQYYSEWKIVAGQSLLRMVANMTNLEQDRMRAKLAGRPSNIDETLDITSVYPTYHYAENTVFVPAAFFQWPFHLPDNMMPYYLKFALIGSGIAAEMVKCLDTIGANWEASGTRSGQRISIVTAEAETCLRGRLTAAGATRQATPLNPALSSILGLQVAAEAYRLYSGRSGRQFSLPTVSFSPAESLFVAFAQAHCGYERPEFLLRQAGSHLPLRDRVRLALQYNTLFRQLFECPAAIQLRNCLFD